MMNNDKTYNNTSLLNQFYKEDKEGLAIAETAVKDLQKFEGNGAVSTGTGEMDWRGKNGGVRTIGVGISTEFLTKGYINLTGKEVNSPAQLAAIAQVYRDPRFETLRFIYMKGNTIVGHEGITSKLPAAAAAFSNLPDRESCKDEQEFLLKVKTTQVKFFMNMIKRMERLNADGYYLLHNHCSGIDVRPSQEDISMTLMYQNTVKGFLGHVIINSNRYGFIDESSQVNVYSLPMKRDELLEPSKPHPLLGENIDSSARLASIAKTIQMEPRYSVVIYVSTKSKIRAIQEVPDGIFNCEKECVNFLRGRMSEFGASRVFAITSNQEIRDKASEMVRKGYLLDAIVTDGNYSVTSIRECGINPSGFQDVSWMGRKMNRGIKVRERNKTIYSYEPNSEKITMQQPAKDKTLIPGIGL